MTRFASGRPVFMRLPRGTDVNRGKFEAFYCVQVVAAALLSGIR